MSIDWFGISTVLFVYVILALLGLGVWYLIVGRREAERRSYIRFELRRCSWNEADKLLKLGMLPFGQFWRIAAEDDTNLKFNTVYLERVCRAGYIKSGEY